MTEPSEVLEAVKSLHVEMGHLRRENREVWTNQEVMNERFKNHSENKRIHEEVPEACIQCKDTKAIVENHEKEHTAIVKKDLGGIIGKPILAGLLIAFAAYAISGLFTERSNTSETQAPVKKEGKP